MLLAAVSCGAVSTAAAAGPSAYEQLDRDKLAKKLVDMNMTELLQALAAGSAQDVEGKALLVRSMLNRALRTSDQEKRDQILKEVTVLQSRLVEATAELVTSSVKILLI